MNEFQSFCSKWDKRTNELKVYQDGVLVYPRPWDGQFVSAEAFPKVLSPDEMIQIMEINDDE